MSTYEADRDNVDEHKNLPDLNRGGGGASSGTLNTPELVNRIKSTLAQRGMIWDSQTQTVPNYKA